ncbi:Hypothetical_protein [Hexamita inflata]|uniref:Hypothetical_protein n=1 Tax=Hexamita inflata TaxID=28002 RepID=A0AA86U3J0_9EUKA|nr:Hypothetical protein HINF_LOCUS28530 [Hexamita inflata]
MDVVNASDRMQSQSETVCVLSRKLRGVCSWITSQTSSASQAQQRLCAASVLLAVWPPATSGGDSVGSSNSWQTAVLLLGQPTTYVFTFSGGSQQPVQLSDPSLFQSGRNQNIMPETAAWRSVFIIPDVRAAVCCSLHRVQRPRFCGRFHGQAGCLADKDNSGIVSLACRPLIFALQIYVRVRFGPDSFLREQSQSEFCVALANCVLYIILIFHVTCKYFKKSQEAECIQLPDFRSFSLRLFCDGCGERQ